MTRFALLAVVALFAGWNASGQTCTPTTLFLTSYFEAGGPSTVSLSIQGPNGDWYAEGLQIGLNAEDNDWQETFCLWPGCYAVYLTGDVPLNPENFGVEMASSGVPVPFEISFGDATVFLDVCVEPAVNVSCPEAIDYMNVEGCQGAFEIGSFVEGESVVWQFGDGSEPVVGGHFITHAFPENGVYVIHAYYTSNLCPIGVELVGTVEVTDCEDEEMDCSFEMEHEAFPCGEFVAWATNLEVGTPSWYVNDTFIGAGMEIAFNVNQYTDDDCFVLMAIAESDACPEGWTTELVLCEEDCEQGGDCEVDIEAYTMDGMWYEFVAVGMPSDATFQWYINDQPIEGATGPTFESGFDFNPWWWVCVEAVSPNCPQGSEACYYGMEVNGCPDNLQVTELENPCARLFTFETDGAPAVETQWYVDGELVEVSSGPGFDWNFGSNGVYIVEAYYSSLSCGGQWYMVTVEVTGCGEEPSCGLQLAHGLLECNDFYFEAYDFPEDVTLWWTLDGEPWNNGLNYTTLFVEDMECHVVGVGYETPDCPEGVFAEVQICPEDCTPSCNLTIASESLADGIYLFTAIDNATGEPVDGDLWWTFGATGSAVGNPVTWTWGEDAPAVSEVCVWCSDVPEDLVCMTYQPIDMGCEEVQLVLTADLAAQAFLALEFYITADLMGYDLNPFYINDALNLIEGAAGDTLTFCAPPACFELFMQAPSGPVEGIESVVLEALNGNLEAIASLDLLVAEWGTFAFGLAEECFNDVAAPASAVVQPLAVYPNPARDQVQLVWPVDERLDVEIRDVRGAVVDLLSGHPAGRPIDTSSWPAGTYFLQVTGEDFASAVVRLVVMR